MLRRIAAASALALAIFVLAVIFAADRPDDEATVTLIAVGDVLFDRGIATKIAEHGLDWPFSEVSEVIGAADLAFCNLECPISEDGIRVNKPNAFRAHPSTVQCLVDAGFNIVSLANNHTLDCGRDGLVETMEHLDSAGIAHVGAGMTLEEAGRPRVIEIEGIRIAFLAMNTLLPEGVWLRPDAPNVSALELDTIESEVSAAARVADVVIVSIHWGIEYSKVPHDRQVELARRLIDAGAHLILGHHPHVLQPVEEYNGGVIAYSLGDFLFDSRLPQCRESMILKCRLTKSGVADYEIIPVELVNFRPTLKR